MPRRCEEYRGDRLVRERTNRWRSPIPDASALLIGEGQGTRLGCFGTDLTLQGLLGRRRRAPGQLNNRLGGTASPDQLLSQLAARASPTKCSAASRAANSGHRARSNAVGAYKGEERDTRLVPETTVRGRTYKSERERSPGSPSSVIPPHSGRIAGPCFGGNNPQAALTPRFQAWLCNSENRLRAEMRSVDCVAAHRPSGLAPTLPRR